MKWNLLLSALGLWLLILVVAIANGALREFVISPRLGTAAGHIISTVILGSLILLITYLFVARVNGRYAASDMLLVGAFWLLLTLVFEFGFGYLRGNTWEAMLADYNLLKGRVWVLIPLITLLAPYLMYRVVRK